MMGASGGRSWVLGISGAVATAVVIGVPTDVVPTSLFTRMTPVRPQDYAFLGATSLLMGALAGTYAARTGGRVAGRIGFGSGLLGYLAVGCPICNKLVVMLMGVSGALSVFAPLQPLLGGLGVGLGALALVARLRVLRRGCPLQDGSGGDASPVT